MDAFLFVVYLTISLWNENWFRVSCINVVISPMRSRIDRPKMNTKELTKMLKNISLALSLFIVTACIGIDDVASDSSPISHEIWNNLLQKHVDNTGLVNYKGIMKDSLQFNRYLGLLKANHPNNKNWSEDEQLAYWINAYNAFTVKLIIDYYPVKSIKDIAGSIPFINSPWDLKFIKIEGETYDLNNIEHGIIRENFSEPRIHFALVCAAISCPRLRNEAFTPSRLDQQLEEETKYFFNNTTKNKISADKIQLSKLLSWYWGDFEGVAKSRAEYVNRYSTVKANSSAKVDYLDYSWELNEQ